jgi:hypothetical protein
MNPLTFYHYLTIILLPVFTSGSEVHRSGHSFAWEAEFLCSGTTVQMCIKQFTKLAFFAQEKVGQ